MIFCFTVSSSGKGQKWASPVLSDSVQFGLDSLVRFGLVNAGNASASRTRTVNEVTLIHLINMQWPNLDIVGKS